MNKAELVAAVAEKTNSTKKDAEAAINALLETVEESGIKEGDCAFAVLAQAGANETSVKAAIDAEDSSITFTLDSNGANDSTLINWMVVRNS